MNCVICKGKILGFGNNAWPLHDGQCCDICNGTVVLLRRLEDMLRSGSRKKAKGGSID